MAGIAISSKLIFPEIKNELVNKFDYISIENNPYLPPHEQTHVDLQICKLDSKNIIVNPTISAEITNKLTENNIDFCFAENKNSFSEYPTCAYIDCLVCGNFLFHKLSISSKILLERARNLYFLFLDVNQGYSGCSAFYYSKLDMIITSEPSIINKARSNSFNLFKIPTNVTESIKIEGYNHGFIGGCLGYSSETDTLFVNGSLSKTIPELYQIIIQTGTKIVECDRDLTDIGGILII